MTWRIGVGGVWHETNTFARGRTELDDFGAYCLADGSVAVLEACAGTRTDVGGALAGCRQYGARAEPLFYGAAVPSATVAGPTREAIWERLLFRLERALPLDGLVLALHGAMVCDDLGDPESDLIARIRELTEVPVAVVLDLHANPGRDLLDIADIVIAYNTYPHVDPYERGEDAVRLLVETLEGRLEPNVAWRRLPLLTCPLAQATDEQPMAGLLELAHDLENRELVACASVAPGYPYADVERLGFTAVVTGGAESEAAEAAERIAEAAWSARERFRRKLVPVNEAVERALESARTPVVLVDVADNVGGGAPGDGTAIVEALFEAGCGDAVAVLYDPEAVTAASAAGEGAVVDLLVGGKLDDRHGAAVAVRGRVGCLARVRYDRSGSYMTGQQIDLGQCAVVEAEGIELVLTSRRAMPFDADHLRVVGIDPESRRVIVAKSAVAWRAAFGELAAEAIFVDTPGICTCQLDRLEYENAPRPIVPLDTTGETLPAP